MENDHRPADNRRCFTFQRRHCFFFLLVLGVVFFFYCTDIQDMAPEWNAIQWMNNHSGKLFNPFKGTYRWGTNLTATAASTTLTHGATTAQLPQNSTHEPTTRWPRSVSSRVTKRTQKPQTTRRIPVPYVSPGPYLVEYPYEYHFTINEPKKCEQEKPFVVLIVQVAPRNRAHRDVIRSTWGSERRVQGQTVTLFFLLGMQTGDDAQQVHQQLMTESTDHHDLIQSDFVDCYKNLTIKTMVMMEWLNSSCSNAAYAMKIDSDMFLNVPNLVSLLLKASRTNYMTGLVAHGGQVLRDPKSKWFLPVDLFSEPTYPPYALGLGYILSLDLARKLIEASRHVKAFYIEDVYLGLCMRHLGIPPTDPPNGGYFHVFPLSYTRCGYSKIIATTTPENMDRELVWRDFKKPGPYC